MSSRPGSRVDVTEVSKLGGRVVEQVIEDRGAGRTTFTILFTDGTQLGWSYRDGGTFSSNDQENPSETFTRN